MNLRLTAILTILMAILFAQSAYPQESSLIDDVALNPLKKLEKLVNEEQYDKAYELVQELLFDNEGDPQFDLLYGKITNETGRYGEALFVFERLALSDPDKSQVQFGLGKAYYKSGNKKDAKPHLEFALLNNEGLSEQEKNQLASYLSVMSSGGIDGANQDNFKGIFGLFLGYDDNVTSLSDDDLIFRNRLGGYRTILGAEKDTSTYVSPNLNLSYLKSLSDKTAIEFIGSFSADQYKSELEAYNNSTASLEVANPWYFDTGIARFSIRQTLMGLDGEKLSELSQIDASWLQNVDWLIADSIQSAFTVGALRYDSESQSYKDVNLYALKVSLDKQCNQLTHTLAITYGADETKGIIEYDYWLGLNHVIVVEEADDFSREYVILAYSLNYNIDSKTALYGNLNVQESSYEDVDHLHPNEVSILNAPVWEKRDGYQLALSLGARYKLNKDLQLETLVIARESTSEVNFYNFSRNTVEVGAMYKF